MPFAAPVGWLWTCLSALFKVITDGDHQPPPRAEEGVAFLTIGNITTGRLDFAGCRLVPETYFRSLAPYRTPVKGDILYTVVGATYGRPALVDTDREFCVQRHIAILKPTSALSLQFLVLLLASPLVYEQASSSTTGSAQPTIALRPLRNFVVPLPPLAEQHRNRGEGRCLDGPLRPTRSQPRHRRHHPPPPPRSSPPRGAGTSR